MTDEHQPGLSPISRSIVWNVRRAAGHARLHRAVLRARRRSPAFARDLIAFNRQVGEEDDLLTSSVQRGLNAGIPEHGRFLTQAEKLVGEFQRLVAEAVDG